jgi:predicted MFS family arabinose efflux permease
VVSTADRFAMAPMLMAIATGLGAPLATVVSAAGGYFLAYGVMQPVWGTLSDRLGLVRTMRLSLLGAGIASTTSALCTSAAALGVTRALAGACFAAAYPACLIYLGDTVSPEQRQSQIARLMVGIAVGTTVASVGAGALADLASWRVAFLGTGVAALLLVATLRNLPEPGASRRGRRLLPSLGRVFRTPMTVVVLVLALLEGAALLGTLTLIPSALEAAGSSPAMAGLATAGYGASVLAGSSVVAVAAGRRHPSVLIAVGATAALLAAVLLTLSQQAAVGVAASASLGIAWTAMHSSLQTWATEVQPEDRATVVSLFAGALFCGSALATVAVSGLVDRGEYAAVFAGAAVTVVVLGISATTFRARWTRPSG